MTLLADILLAGLAFVGHFSLAVWAYNRLHALNGPPKLLKLLERGVLLVAAGVSLLFVYRWISLGIGVVPPLNGPWPADQWLWLGYAASCWAAAAAVIPLWLVPKLCERQPVALESNDTSHIDVVARLGHEPIGGLEARLIAWFPGNEIFRLAIQRKTLELSGLPAKLDGLSIAHLSDLHMTGRVGREYYDLIVDETNALEPDLIVITGDILERECCLGWVRPTLGRLRARHGIYFILGNHEQRLGDVAPLRKTLATAGLVDLGSRSRKLSISGEEVVLAGNELPWFGNAPSWRSKCGDSDKPAFRILLAHTPDQLPWAKTEGFHLMLAGHNHGGQIRLPWLGALIVPSKFGWRYAGGVYEEPPTLLHVSRGLGGIHPIRLNCPPELALLVLRPALAERIDASQ